MASRRFGLTWKAEPQTITTYRFDPDRQLEFDELVAALMAAESFPPDDPVMLYVGEIAFVEPPPPGTETNLLAAVRSGDEAARNQLTELNLWEVVRFARQFVGRGVPSSILCSRATSA